MIQRKFLNKFKYYLAFELIFVSLVMLFSSIGAFFHFLLDHEISIIESWLHHNHWEIIIISKILSLFLLIKWFDIRLYKIQSLKELSGLFLKRPEQKALVISLFVLLSFLGLGDFKFVIQNWGYWYNHLMAFLGITIFFGMKFVFMAFLNQVYSEAEYSFNFIEALFFLVIFGISYRLSVPDYYHLFEFSMFCFSILFFLTGLDFKNSSNTLVFIFLFISPMAAFCGLDPVWGDDFSIFRSESKIKLPFLVVIWMVSFIYYRYRELILTYSRKFIR